MAGAERAVETVGLSKRFPKDQGWRGLFGSSGRTVALDDVTLSIPPGEIFGILGPNGAGKTTLIKILCTLITPTEGTARVGGFDVVRHDEQVRRRIGFIYGDERSFFWRLSLLENLMYYAALYRIPKRRVRRRIDELLEMVGLRDSAHARMHAFSSGMKQRAAIARGLLADPEIMFLDEPTTAVDPLAAQQVRQLVLDLVAQQGRRTVILTTNIMDEAEMLCDRIALINHGRIELLGTLRSLRLQFQPDERYALVVSGLGEARLREISRLPGVREVDLRAVDFDRVELTVCASPGSDVIPDCVDHLVRASGRIWSCARQELSLEELFHMAFNGSRSPEPAPALIAQPEELVGSAR